MPMADLNKSNLANKMTKKLTKIVSPHNKIVLPPLTNVL